MAYGKIKIDTVVYDNSGSDVEIAVSGIPSAADLAAKADTSALTAKADLASPALTGTPTAPTASSGTNTTQVATTAFVSAATAGSLSADTATTWTKGQRGEVTTLTGTSPAPNLDDSNNFTLTTSGNTTFGLPTNVAVGQTGSIFIVYGGTHTLAFNAAYKFVGGAAGITPTSTSAAIDRIDYIVQNAAAGYVCLTCNFTANYVA